VGVPHASASHSPHQHTPPPGLRPAAMSYSILPTLNQKHFNLKRRWSYFDFAQYPNDGSSFIPAFNLHLRRCCFLLTNNE